MYGVIIFQVDADKMTVKTTRVNEDKPLLTGPATLYNQNG